MMNKAPFIESILVAKIDDESIGPAVYCAGYPWLVAYLVGAGVTSSGVVTIEEAPTEDFAGTWSSIGTINAVDGTSGAVKALALTARHYQWVRARVSTVIGGGGSVSVTLCGSPSA
jgi:hypothetical protein